MLKSRTKRKTKAATPPMEAKMEAASRGQVCIFFTLLFYSWEVSIASDFGGGVLESESFLFKDPDTSLHCDELLAKDSPSLL